MNARKLFRSGRKPQGLTEDRPCRPSFGVAWRAAGWADSSRGRRFPWLRNVLDAARPHRLLSSARLRQQQKRRRHDKNETSRPAHWEGTQRDRAGSRAVACMMAGVKFSCTLSVEARYCHLCVSFIELLMELKKVADRRRIVSKVHN